MQKPGSRLLSESTQPCSPSAEGSVARAIGQTAASDPRSGPFPFNASKAEFERLERELEKRDHEIAQLKARLAKYECEPPPTSAAKPEAAPAQASVTAPHEPLFAATPVSDPRDAYPTLQRVALVLESCSLLPPPISASQPPSQRRSARRSCEIELEFTEESHFYAGLTQDISQGGVFIATYKLLPIGRRLMLNFDLPDGTHINANGEVRWLRDTASPSARPGMGIAFLDLPEESERAIAEFCKERPPLYMDL